MSERYKRTTTEYAPYDACTTNRNEIESAIEQCSLDGNYRRILRWILNTQWPVTSDPDAKLGHVQVTFRMEDVGIELGCEVKKARTLVHNLESFGYLKKTLVPGGKSKYLPQWGILFGVDQRATSEASHQKREASEVEPVVKREASQRTEGSVPKREASLPDFELENGGLPSSEIPDFSAGEEPSRIEVAILRGFNHLGQVIRGCCDKLIKSLCPQATEASASEREASQRTEGSLQGALLSNPKDQSINQLIHSLIDLIQHTVAEPSPTKTEASAVSRSTEFKWPYSMYIEMKSDPKKLSDPKFVQRMYEHAVFCGRWKTDPESRILFFAMVLEARQQAGKKAGGFILNKIRDGDLRPASEESIERAREYILAWDEKQRDERKREFGPARPIQPEEGLGDAVAAALREIKEVAGVT